MFVSTLVVQVCLHAQTQEPVGRIKLTPAYFMRDLIVYLFVMVYLLVVMLLVGYIDMLFAIGFVVTYAVYVIIVVTQSSLNKNAP